MTRLKCIRAGVGWLGAGLMGVAAVACSGAGGSDGPPATARTVKLAANSQISPWDTDALDFQVAPALANGETMSCQIDEGPDQPCQTGASTGRVAYAGLARQEHVLRVRSGRTGAQTVSRTTWKIVNAEVVVYGATPSGIVAALSAAREGRTVVLVEATARLGGMMAGGLAKTDIGSAPVPPIGGISADFFDRAHLREVAGGDCSDRYPCAVPYDIEPHVAESVFAEMLAEAPLISIQRSQPLVEVRKQENRLGSIVTTRGEITAGVFIDASYEGDLMAAAGVSHVSGREARAVSGDGVPPGDVEDNAGFGAFARPLGVNVDPFVVPGVPASGLIPFVEPTPDPLPETGSADDRLMAYNYRLCVTDDPSNRVPFGRPDDFDARLYEGSARVAEGVAAVGRTPLDELFFNPHPTVHSKDRKYFKYDLNGGPAFSTDVSAPGWNQAYPSAGRAQRAAIEAAYRSYGRGLLYAWRTDKRFGALNAKVERFGYCADEFLDNDFWPYALYVRESRRMVGEYVMNQNDVTHNGRRPVLADSIGMGGYGMDSHYRRLTTIKINGRDLVVTEGFAAIHPQGDPRYRVAYRSLVPRRAEAVNLLNPVTPSSTALAFSSLRMEPTLMVLGQAAGTAASMALEWSTAVQDVGVSELQDRLQRAGQIIE